MSGNISPWIVEYLVSVHYLTLETIAEYAGLSPEEIERISTTNGGDGFDAEQIVRIAKKLIQGKEPGQKLVVAAVEHAFPGKSFGEIIVLEDPTIHRVLSMVYQEESGLRGSLRSTLEVLEGFEKKTRGTPRHEIALKALRLAEESATSVASRGELILFLTQTVFARA